MTSRFKSAALLCALFVLGFKVNSFAEDFTLVLIGQTHAMLYHCNCPIEPDGGIARRATLIQQLRKDNPNILLVDSGSFFAGGVMDQLSQGKELDQARTLVHLKAMDLMKYDAITDKLQPTSDLLNGDSEILKSVAGSVKEWAGNWDAVWDNVLLRAQVKDAIVQLAQKTKNKDFLEAPFCIAANDQFHRISESVREETGALDSKRIFFEYDDWMHRHAKRIEGRK